MEKNRARGDAAAVPSAEDLSARPSRPGDLDLRRRDPACHRETLAVRIGACNGARQGWH
jgi:hypothetical protein